MLKVLLAEADRDLRQNHVEFFADRGFQIDTVDSALQCVAKLRQVVPDLLVLDLELPWGGGDGVVDFLSENPTLLPNQVILTSRVESAHVVHRWALPPAIRTLTKPYPVSVLWNRAANDGSNHSPVTNQRRGILIVDDDRALCDLLKMRLRHQGYRVWTAASGEEALDRCCDQGEEIAVVLLDVQLPGLDSQETLEGIRAFDANIPVCFMTGDPGVPALSDLLQKNGRHLLRKPFHMDEMLRVVRQLAHSRSDPATSTGDR